MPRSASHVSPFRIAQYETCTQTKWMACGTNSTPAEPMMKDRSYGALTSQRRPTPHGVRTGALNEEPKRRGRPPIKDQTVFKPLNVDPTQLARAMLQPPPKGRPRPEGPIEK